MQRNQSTMVIDTQMKWKVKEQALKEQLTMAALVEKALNEYFARLEKETK